MASSAEPITVVVLAAQRAGQDNPLAVAHQVSHKCLVPIGGHPLIKHVLETLAQVANLHEVRISIEPAMVGEIERIVPPGLPVAFTAAANNIADSVAGAMRGVSGPVVITTADHVLLAPASVEAVAARMRGGVDAVFAAATRDAVLSAHPEGQRRFYKFGKERYSNCNLYGLHGSAALRLAEAFRTGGQFIKNPRRIAQAFGVFNLLLFRTGLLSLDAAMRRVSRRFGVRIEALVLADGAQAIDVDNERTYRVVETLLNRRSA